mgnify:CR=1 FL=1
MRAVEAAAPVTEGELDSLFADIAGVARIALAVSGGADSLALLDCVDRWRKHGRATDVTLLTVDHRLRPESADEAAMVADIAVGRGLRHRILAWDGLHPERDVKAAARHARYGLLLGATREAGASHLLVAHHRDDQAETFLMRLARGSGLFGLAAMRPSLQAGEVTILRPFLDLPRSRLAATTAAAGLVPADDPMNHDPRFERARIRRLMPLFAAEGLDPAMLAATAARLRMAADAIDRAADAAIARHVTTDAMAVASAGRDLFSAPEEVRRRVLVRILMAVGGEPYPPRSERLEALDRAMAEHGKGRFKRTLAGTVIEWRGGKFAFHRELGREGIAAVALVPGSAFTFDGRFRVEAGEGLPAGLTLSALGEAGRLAIGATAGEAPAGAIAALPAIRRETAILAVPSIGFGDVSLPVAVRPVLAAKLARPALFPDFT